MWRSIRISTTALPVASAGTAMVAAAAPNWSPDYLETRGPDVTIPPADRHIWGYPATSAADVARIYEYLVDEPWAIKQGWSGYGNVEPSQECAVPTTAHLDGALATASATPEAAPAVHAEGTSYEDSPDRFTTLTRMLCFAGCFS